jgi:tRNA A22 N-methylase
MSKESREALFGNLVDAVLDAEKQIDRAVYATEIANAFMLMGPKLWAEMSAKMVMAYYQNAARESGIAFSKMTESKIAKAKIDSINDEVNKISV